MELTRRLFWLQLAAQQRVITAAGSDCVMCVRHALRLPRASTAQAQGAGLHRRAHLYSVAYRHLGWPPAD